ncbi:hypothetical protein L1049_007086 [Liquidambar formosana]|uniref:Clp R domain-containing protein n=1 Tax=Liquidambar formosana TaxID=63359 RepID=A0AAP0WUK1_LIQFO
MAAHALYRLQASTPISRSDCRRPNPVFPPPSRTLTPHSLHNSWLGTTKLLLHSSNLRPLKPKHRFIISIVSFSLPTAKPERVSSSDKIPKWSSKAVKAFAMAELEARKLKYPTTGTECLLMGVLIEGTSPAAKYLQANGIALFKVREETVKSLGKADMYFFSPEHPPLTDSAQRALDWAIDEKLQSGESGEITTTHLLLAIWSEEKSPGHKILATLGFNHDKAKELKSLSSKPGFADG